MVDTTATLQINADFASYLTIFQILFFILIGMYLGMCCCTYGDSCENTSKENRKKSEWDVQPSKMAKNTKNLIREIVESLNPKPNPEKQVIALSVGDPCVYENIICPQELVEAVIETVKSIKYNGYAAAPGHIAARKTIAEYMSHSGVEYEAKDIMLFNGCSGSLENCILLLADGDENHNILIPKPGFPIGRTIAEGVGIKCKDYNLLPHQNWIVDIHHLEGQIDNNTVAILVINPSNPCGSVYKADHLQAILDVANKHKIPIIADEIYERLTFGETKFVSMAALESDVPLFVCAGISKMFLAPGWRLGWVAIHDPRKILDKSIRKGLYALSTRILGSCTLIQGALIKCLNHIPQSYYDHLCNTLRINATVAYDIVKEIRGLTPIMPEGALYMMIEIDRDCFPKFKNSIDFVEKLMEEESVFCLPGECFKFPYFLRIVITPPAELLREACDRMSNFCARHIDKHHSKIRKYS